MQKQDIQTEVHKRPSAINFVWTLFVTSAVLLLLGVFTLDRLAESSVLYHALQHLVIFSSGCSMGITLLRGYSEKSRG